LLIAKCSELGRCERLTAVGRRWPNKMVLLQPFRKQAKPLAVPPQGLTLISCIADEGCDNDGFHVDLAAAEGAVVIPPLTQGCDRFRSNACDLRFGVECFIKRSSMIGELQRTSSRTACNVLSMLALGVTMIWLREPKYQQAQLSLSGLTGNRSTVRSSISPMFSTSDCPPPRP
jgi:hypothetical protein